MFRNIPIFAIAMTAGFAAIVFSGLRPSAAHGGAAIQVDADAWFI
jgi:hypothetical protein